MEQRLPTFKQSDFSSGMVSGVNESIRPPGAVGLGLNVEFDYEIGSAATRLGTFIIGGQMVDGKSVLGLHNHVSSVSKLFAAINDTDDATSVIYDDAGTVQVTGLTASKKTRFLTFLGATLVINGADAERSWTPSGGWITTGGAFDLANIPGSNLNNLVTTFLSRVYLAGDTTNPTRLYYSSVSSGTAVSWTSGNGYVDIDAGSERGPITALAKVPGYILIFKTRAMTRWNFNSAFPEELVNTGTPSQESVIESGGLVAFYSNSNEKDKGFFITNGGRPQPISHDAVRPIKKWIEAIPASAEASIAGRATNNGFAWSVGDLTVDGQTYHNVELCYNRILNQWSARAYPTKFTVYTSYLDGESKNVSIGGDNDGCVIQLDKADRYVDYVTLSGEPGESAINFDIRTLPEKHGLNQLKQISDKIVFETRNGQGATPYLRADGGNVVEMPSLTSDIAEAKLPNNVTGSYFEYGLRGTVQGKRLILKELEVPNINAIESYA